MTLYEELRERYLGHYHRCPGCRLRVYRAVDRNGAFSYELVSPCLVAQGWLDEIGGLFCIHTDTKT